MVKCTHISFWLKTSHFCAKKRKENVVIKGVNIAKASSSTGSVQQVRYFNLFELEICHLFGLGTTSKIWYFLRRTFYSLLLVAFVGRLYASIAFCMEKQTWKSILFYIGELFLFSNIIFYIWLINCLYCSYEMKCLFVWLFNMIQFHDR